MNRVRCLVLNAALGPLDYKVPEGLYVEPGSVVECPLGPRTVIGIVWEAERLPGTEVPAEKLRNLRGLLPIPPLSAPLRRLIEWTADYYVASLASVARMALSSGGALKGPATMTEYRLTGGMPERMTPQRERAMEALEGEQANIRELAGIAGVSEAVLRGLVNQGVLEPVEVDCDRPYDAARPDFAHVELSAEQRAASDILAEAVRKAEFAPFLLDGVTGSGKTEVYFDAVQRCLDAERQVLILLPEIALSAAWKQRFHDRFGVMPVEWHSDVAPTRKRRAWRHAHTGAAQVVVGARSALFLPFARLGLIVVDEEHEQAYKQEDQVVYHARDMAVLRARLESCPVVLATATPSLESWVNAGMAGDPPRYRRIALPKRIGLAQLPEIRAVDLRRTPPERGTWLAPPLVEAVNERLEAGEQSLLFLNRRGYAPLTLCGSCGHKVTCPNCDSWMVTHRLAGRLKCHYCGYEARPQRDCAECGEEDSMQACGPGVERLAEEVLNRFPEARFAVFSSDTVTTPASAEAFVRSVTDGEVDIIIGTQMVAKGHHFPGLTLVGIVDADLGLAGGDLRAAERTFAMLAQVAGRAGRAERPGLAMLQTTDTETPVMRALLSGDRDKFLKAEAESRRIAGMPPFARLAAIVLSANDSQRLHAAMQALAASRPNFHGVSVYGPSVAPLGFLRGKHRGRALVQVEKTVDIQAVIQGWLATVKLPSGVRLQVDIDPYSFV